MLADVDGDIEQCAGGTADQFALGVWGTLEMQAADCAGLCAARFVVLDELVVAYIFREQIGTKCFGEIAAFVAVMAGDQERDAGDVVGFYLHNNPVIHPLMGIVSNESTCAVNFSGDSLNQCAC